MRLNRKLERIGTSYSSVVGNYVKFVKDLSVSRLLPKLVAVRLLPKLVISFSLHIQLGHLYVYNL